MDDAKSSIRGVGGMSFADTAGCRSMLPPLHFAPKLCLSPTKRGGGERCLKLSTSVAAGVKGSTCSHVCQLCEQVLCDGESKGCVPRLLWSDWLQQVLLLAGMALALVMPGASVTFFDAPPPPTI